MKANVRFIILIAICLTGYHFMFGQGRKSSEVTIVNEVAATARPKLKVKARSAKSTILVRPKIAQEPFKAKSLEVSRPRASQKPEAKQVNFFISEQILADLEAEWNNLPATTVARREDRGWRMVRVDQDSGFTRIGIRTGDLITTDFLKNLEMSNLQQSDRFQQILNRVTR